MNALMDYSKRDKSNSSDEDNQIPVAVTMLGRVSREDSWHAKYAALAMTRAEQTPYYAAM